MFKKEKNEIKSSSHSKYRCQYHIVFTEQISIKEFIDPFTGNKKQQAKKTTARERLPEMVMRC